MRYQGYVGEVGDPVGGPFLDTATGETVLFVLREGIGHIYRTTDGDKWRVTAREAVDPSPPGLERHSHCPVCRTPFAYPPKADDED